MANPLPALLAPFASNPAAGPLPPLLANTTSLAAAVAGRSLGTGYASGGFLVLYYIGVSKMLQQLGVVRVGETKSAGTSVGSIAQGLDQGMGDHDDFINDHAVRFCETCRANRYCFGTLDTEFTKLVRELMTHNKGSGRRISGMACSVFSRGPMSAPVGDYTCDFANDEDLVQAVRASSYVPGWSGAAPAVMYRGAPAYDGAFSQYVPCPPNITFCIKVSGMPPIDPSTLTEGLTGGQLGPTLRLALRAALSLLGPSPVDAIKEGLRVNTLGTMGLSQWFRAFATIQQPGTFDIYPGRFGKSPLTPIQWALYMLTPPPRDVIFTMYRAGQDDALAWARAQGWPAALSWKAPPAPQAAGAGAKAAGAGGAR
ncbi:MAG: hypothetical protein J3K34DRAFT_105768 [Monoraphidium minutum]|nr:MAG: hypothetical protein J3K34DRAFT_105768 [Monoraphidium minutum]